MERARVSARLCVGVLVVAMTMAASLDATGSAASTATASNAVTPCSAGLVALTFDDGPSPALTPDFVTLLHRERVPATFFVLGERVRANPGLARRASALGFTLGNHSYYHRNLVRLSDKAVASNLRRTRLAITSAGARTSNLMRPPFGRIDERVRTVVRGMGLVPVLWTADPTDWKNRSARSIAISTFGQLRPQETNIVLLHDGVTSSGQTLRALPRIIRGGHDRGYCFAGLDARGRPRPPVPLVRVSDGSVQERPGGSVMTVTLTLDRPTSRVTSVRIRTVAVSAAPGRDYIAIDRRVRFPIGARKATVQVRVPDDLRDENTEWFSFRLSDARGLRIKDATGLAGIRDDDPPPRLTVLDSEVTEPASGSVEVPIGLRLSRASGKRIVVTVSTQTGSADAADFVPETLRVTFAPGQAAARFIVTVLADPRAEVPETFSVRAIAGSNVDVAGATGVVTILPPRGGRS